MSEHDAEAEPTAAGTGARRRSRRAVRACRETASDDVRAWEDDDRAWGEGGSADDDRLRRDVPPHWG